MYAAFMRRATLRILRLLVVLTACSLFGTTARSQQQLRSAANFDFLDTQSHCCEQPAWITLAFTSDNTIAVSRCVGYCSLYLIHWDGQSLHLFAKTATEQGALSIFPADQGLILSTGPSKPLILYSTGLTTSHDLPLPISMFSATGRTAAARTGKKWSVYRFDGALHPVLDGTGSLQSISDDTLVMQDADVVKVKTLEGEGLGSFTIPTKSGCPNEVKIIGRDRLYLNDCGNERIADYSGTIISQLTPPHGCCSSDDQWAEDGQRLLFNYRARKVFFLRNFGEVLGMFATLGMSGEEWPNREVVQVVDPRNRMACLRWQTEFPKANDSVLGKNAAISHSGQLVAIATRNLLSIYRLPSDCQSQGRSASAVP